MAQGQASRHRSSSSPTAAPLGRAPHPRRRSPTSSVGLARGRGVLTHPRRLARVVTDLAPDGALLVDTGYLSAALRLGGYAGPDRRGRARQAARHAPPHRRTEAAGPGRACASAPATARSTLACPISCSTRFDGTLTRAGLPDLQRRRYGVFRPGGGRGHARIGDRCASVRPPGSFPERVSTRSSARPLSYATSRCESRSQATARSDPCSSSWSATSN